MATRALLISKDISLCNEKSGFDWTYNASKSNIVLQALIAFAKYHGCYEEFRAKLESHGIKWHKPNSLMAFHRIMSSNDAERTLYRKK